MNFLRNNGLSSALLVLFLATFFGQSLAGMLKYNNDEQEHGKPPVTYREYLLSHDFLEATAENWESEFLQLFTFVLLTRFLHQKALPSPRTRMRLPKKREALLQQVPWLSVKAASF